MPLVGGLVRKTPRALALLGVAAILVLTVTVISRAPIESRAAGSAGSPGSAWAWGFNGSGQLGNGATADSSTPVAVSLPSGTNATAIAGGGNHSLALTTTGQVLGWGFNFDGELGNGTTTSSSTPVPVSLPSGTIATAIAAGNSHSLALTSTGQVLAWGYNGYGQLGNGTTTSSSTPVAISLPSGASVIAIAGGLLHSLALTSTGQVLAWGYNVDGELGNGTNTKSSTPVQVSLPSGTTVTAIAAGSTHSLALTSTGQVLAWGANGYGQLGKGNINNRIPPTVANVPSGTIVIAIAAGSIHSLALTSTGQVLAWGDNTNGQLGDGTNTSSSTPVMVSALQTVVTAIAAGAYHSLAIQLPAVAVLPAVSDGAYGGYVTAATIQNTGTADAVIRIAYFDQNGAPVGAGDAIDNLPRHASWTVRQDNGNSFPSSGGAAAKRAQQWSTAASRSPPSSTSSRPATWVTRPATAECRCRVEWAPRSTRRPSSTTPMADTRLASAC